MLPAIAIPTVVKNLPWKAIGFAVIAVAVGIYIGMLKWDIHQLEVDVAVAQKAAAEAETRTAKLIADYQAEAAKVAQQVALDNARVISTLEQERNNLQAQVKTLSEVTVTKTKVHTVIKERIVHADPTEDRPVGAILYRTLNDLRCVRMGQTGAGGGADAGCEKGVGEGSP